MNQLQQAYPSSLNPQNIWASQAAPQGVCGGIGSNPLGAMQQQIPQQQALQNPLAPQGWFGNVLGQIGQPFGSAIGGIFGNPALGSSIGGIASQVGRYLPFSADPIQANYAQQLQQLQQQLQQQAQQQALQQALQQAQQISPMMLGQGNPQ